MTDQTADAGDGDTGLCIDPASVADACLLLGYALEKGITVDDAVVDAIARARATLAGPAGNDDALIAVQVQFADAYRELAAKTAPVTAQTLRDTESRFGRPFPLPFGRLLRSLFSLKSLSEGAIWARKLWLWTFVVLFFIVGTEVFEEILLGYYPGDHDPVDGFDGVLLAHQILTGLRVMLPFAYGLLGACAYLLKSCHYYMAQRSFDRRRVPEYYNRMVLGLVSGGAILLLVNQIVDDEGVIINISGAALAFLAGYNTDFLFESVERIVKAILPKVGLRTVQRAVPPGTAPVSIERLVKLMNEAPDDATKKSISALIRKLSDS